MRSPADALWLAFYLPMTAALVLRVRAAGGARGVVFLDILIAIAALGSISAAFVVQAIVADGSSSTAGLVTSLAYPVGDLMLAALVLHLAAASGWSPRARDHAARRLLRHLGADGHDLRLPVRTGQLSRRRPPGPGMGRPVRALRRRGVDAPRRARAAAEPRPARAGRARGLCGRRAATPCSSASAAACATPSARPAPPTGWAATSSACSSAQPPANAASEPRDGAGYPDGLAGAAIPLGARIIFVCDAFDAMLARRPDSAPLGFEPALRELESCAGTQFDPQVVAAFVAVSRARAASPLDVAAVL